ncbi:hypothetical protein [Larkinella sp. C7]|uniref:hypothetical protein n=1 Tax=Larkinella sp. C7 TaxID=2576607 RepID=UPI00111103B7|nr:hypothetical protein [Larkinella sp. C7]
MKNLFCFLFISLLSLGCTSRLQVSVKILDRSFLTESPAFWKEKIRPLEVKARENILSGNYEIIRRTIKANLDSSLNELSRRSMNPEKSRLEKLFRDSKIKAVKDSIDKLLDKLPPTLSPEIANTLKMGGNDIIDTTINFVIFQHRLALSTYDNSLVKPVQEAPSPEDYEIQTAKKLRESLYLLNLGFFRLSSLGEYLRWEIDRLTKEIIPNATKNNDYQVSVDDIVLTTKQITRKASPTAQPFLAIKNDPLASIVAGADKKYWRAVANSAKGKTAIGNSDIAIVMEQNGEYTVKGIRNDATQATKATFAVMNLTIDALAKYSGVDISSNPTDSTSTISGRIIKTDSDLRIIQNKTRAAHLKIFSAILTENAHLSDNATYKTSVNNIKSVFNSSKKTMLNQ